jgi:hypothetical protein
MMHCQYWRKSYIHHQIDDAVVVVVVAIVVAVAIVIIAEAKTAFTYC